MNYSKIIDLINDGKIDDKIRLMICDDDVSSERKRYLDMLDDAYKMFGDGDYHIISAPGRTEIGGNHTDHQHGKVIAASVNLDSVAVTKPNESGIVNFISSGFNIKPIDLSDLGIKEDEINHTESLIRGIAYRFLELGYKIGGFDALSNSKVLIGSGISSSASFEILVCEIFNHLFNEGMIDPVTLAKIAQYAENNYFMKPCGLLDQMAISVGGFTFMDFKDVKKPYVEKIDFDFRDYNYYLVLTNTKGDHAELSFEYAAIPNEMKAVAETMGHEFLSECDEESFYRNLNEIRKAVNNDRAILRAIHLFEENKRVDIEGNAIRNGDINLLLKTIRESGRSSYMYLQNVYPSSRPKSQSLAIALALSDQYLKDSGAFRVHGGGFEGTIQAFVKEDKLSQYLEMMHKLFGEDSTYLLSIRSVGGYCLI